MEDDRLREVVAHGSSTVMYCILMVHKLFRKFCLGPISFSGAD